MKFSIATKSFFVLMILFSAVSNQAQVISGLTSLQKQKPISSGNQNFLLGFFDAGSYHTISIISNSKKASINADLPFLILPQSDSFLIAVQTHVRDSFAVEDYRYDDTLQHYTSEVDITNQPYFTYNWNLASAFCDTFSKRNFTQSYLTDYYFNLDMNIELAVPPFIIFNEAMDMFTGGAHPNWGQDDFGLMLNSLGENHSKPDQQEFIPLPRNSDFTDLFDQWIDTGMYSLQRYLYFKGKAGFYEDYHDEFDTSTFRIHDYDGKELGDADSNDMYIPDVDNLNFLIYHEGGQYGAKVQAFADAPYVSSGDYSFTVEKDLGVLPESMIANNQIDYSFASVDKLIPNLYDFYLSPDRTLIVLVCKSEVPNQEEIKVASMLNGKVLLDFNVNTNSDVVLSAWIGTQQQLLLEKHLKNYGLNFVNSIIQWLFERRIFFFAH